MTTSTRTRQIRRREATQLADVFARHRQRSDRPVRDGLWADAVRQEAEAAHGIGYTPADPIILEDGEYGDVLDLASKLTDPQGRPVAVRDFDGNTADPAAFTEILDAVHDGFGLRKMVMAGDRGMITSARIEAIREPGGRYAWITALRAPAIRKLMEDNGPLQLSLFDEQDLAEITSGGFPGERLIACRNPALAGERARKREALLAATEKLLAPIAARAAAGRLAGAAEIGKKAGEVLNKYKVARHFDVTITDASLTAEPKQAQIQAEARLDGIYVIRTPVPGTGLDAAGTVTAYKNLKHVETGKPQCCHSRGWLALPLVPSGSVFMLAA